MQLWRSISRATLASADVDLQGMALRPPAAHSDQRPYRLYQPEGPRSLEKAVDGAEDAGRGEGQDEPGTAPLQRIKNHHQGYGEQSKS